MTRSRNGSIRPLREKKRLERGFWNAAVPSTCVVPLQQHTGSRLKPLVQAGDTVREGMIIADGDGRLAVPVHAPIPGRVTMIGRTVLFDNTSCTAVMIELAGEFDRLGKRTDRQDWSSLDSETIRDLVRNAGVIVGGRSPVPAHAYMRRGKLGPPPTLVLDLAETEPYLTADNELTCASPDEVVEGLRIACRMLDTDLCTVVASRGNGIALAAIRGRLGRDIAVRRVPHRYPANLDSQIRRAVMSSRDVDDPSRELFLIRPSTAFAIFEAVVLGKPQIERVIAVGGGAVARPAHIRIRIGTSVADVLSECGGLLSSPARIVAGGPLTGGIVHNVAAPLPKSTTAVLALSEEEIHAGSEQPCIRCGACIRGCPVSINPILIHDLVSGGRHDAARAAGLGSCVECGLCAHLCPSRIPLVERLREGKSIQEVSA